jgi:glutamate-1-semialdehyde 2,1-aminomutase
MAAGLTTLTVLQEDRVHERLEILGARLEGSVAEILTRRGVEARLVRQGSIFWLSLQPGPPPRTAAAVSPGAAKRFAPLYHYLLSRGIYMGPSAYEVSFLSAAHGGEHVDRFCQVLDDAFAQGIGA